MNNKQMPLISAVVLFVIVIGALFGYQFLKRAIAKDVVKLLKQEYVPGPYTPGFDPDKVDPKVFQKMTVHPTPMQVPYVSPQATPAGPVNPLDWNEAWSRQWEAGRY